MSSFERIVGNIIVGVLIVLIILSFLYNTFILLFRDGRGSLLSGGRASIYMSEGEQ